MLNNPQYVVHRYKHQAAWLNDYTSNPIIFDASPEPLKGAIAVPNVGSDISWKFKWIIDNYDDLPEVSILIKCNLWDYIKPREFEKIKDNQTFTPILSQDHCTYKPVCWYENGLYCEINNYFYLNAHPARYADEIKEFFKMDEREYNKFAPGSGYILTKRDILKHPMKIYEKLRSYLNWAVYPGDAQLMERNLYYLWH